MVFLALNKMEILRKKYFAKSKPGLISVNKTDPGRSLRRIYVTGLSTQWCV